MPSFVRQSTGTSVSVTLGAAALNGNVLILFVCARASSATLTSVASTNTTWTKIFNLETGAIVAAEMWMGAVSGGDSGTTVSLTYTGGTPSAFGINVAEFSGVNTTVDPAAVTNSASSSAPSTAAYSAGTAGDLILCQLSPAKNMTVGPGGSWNALTAVAAGSANWVYPFYILSGSGAQSASMTLAGSAFWNTAIVALTASGGGTGPFGTLMMMGCGV